jgi:hypothetical protein
LNRTSEKRIRVDLEKETTATPVSSETLTDCGCACIEAVFDQLFGDGTQVNNDLA